MGENLENKGSFFSSLPLWLIIAVAVIVVIGIGLTVWLILRKKKKKKILPEEPVRKITVGKLHEQGAREGQQDCFAVSDESLMDTHGLLAVVADGMGGLADGDKVSATGVQAVLDGFAACRDGMDPEQILLVLLKNALWEVNKLLGEDGLRKSGSTLVMGLIKEGKLSFLSVGDSRICLFRGGMLLQLNREHIYKNELALKAVNGEKPIAEVYSDPQGTGLISFLGIGKIPYVDMGAGPIKLLPGDKILLMSDGVYNALSEEELTQMLEGDPNQAIREIHSAICRKNYSNQDNYTAVILSYEDS